MRMQGMLPLLMATLLVGSGAAAQQAPIGHRQPKMSDLPGNVARREQASQPPQKGEQRPQSQGQASAAPAKGSGPPNIDIQKTCRESSSALAGLTDNSKQDLDSCISDEQAARNKLTKDWANYSAFDKSACINPKEYLPGYVEWQSCIEMTRDVVKMRQNQTASARDDSHASGESSGTSSKSRECPVVKTADDGSIDGSSIARVSAVAGLGQDAALGCPIPPLPNQPAALGTRHLPTGPPLATLRILAYRLAAEAGRHYRTLHPDPRIVAPGRTAVDLRNQTRLLPRHRPQAGRPGASVHPQRPSSGPIAIRSSGRRHPQRSTPRRYGATATALRNSTRSTAGRLTARSPSMPSTCSSWAARTGGQGRPTICRRASLCHPRSATAEASVPAAGDPCRVGIAVAVAHKNAGAVGRALGALGSGDLDTATGFNEDGAVCVRGT
jgi:hypothetical protein